MTAGGVCGTSARDERPLVGEEPQTLGVRAVRKVLECRRLIICFWAAVLVASLPLAYITATSTQLRVLPPRGSPTYEGRALLQQDFPGMESQGHEIVLLSCASCSDPLAEPFVQRALVRLAEEMERMHAADNATVVGWDRPTVAVETALQLDLATRALSSAPLPNPFLSADGRTVIYHTKWAYTPVISKRLARFMKFVDGLDRQARGSRFRVYILGPYSLVNVLNSEMITEMMLKEGCVAPFAIMVLLLQVRSLRLPVVAGLTMAVSIAVSVGLLFFLQRGAGVHVSPMCPLLVMALGVALSVDYSLFIFSRFREELQAGRATQRALEVAMEGSGRVIVLSGSILVIGSALNAALPGELVWSMGLTAALTVLVVFLVHVTLTPCIIASFQLFLSHGLTADTVSCGGIDTRGSWRWFKWASFITAGWRPPVVMLMVYGCMVPVILRLFTYQPSTDMGLEIPHGSVTQSAFTLAEGCIPIGEMLPVYMINKEGDIKSDAAFAAGCERIHRLVESTRGTSYELGAGDFTSPYMLPGFLAGLLQHLPGNCPPLTCLRWSGPPPECPFLPSAKELLEGRGSPTSSSLLGLDKAYREVWRLTVNAGNHSALTKISTPYDQVGEKIKGLYDELINVAGDRIHGTNLIFHDISTRSYGRMPLVMALNLIVMSVLIGLTFGTLLVPLKLFMTVVLPLAFVYGIMVCVYQEGIVSWLPLPGLHASPIHWLIPIITLPLQLGLAIDYDIFLFARVMELRLEGYDNRAAVVGALSTTGPTITSAGLIMALAFFGMILSKITMDCQLGMVISFGVLLDAFVIRGILVPCVLSLGDFLNYWPQKMPRVTRSVRDVEEYLTALSRAEKGSARKT